MSNKSEALRELAAVMEKHMDSKRETGMSEDLDRGTEEYLIKDYGPTLGKYIFKTFKDPDDDYVDVKMLGPDLETLHEGYHLGIFEHDLVVKELKRKLAYTETEKYRLLGVAADLTGQVEELKEDLELAKEWLLDDAFQFNFEQYAISSDRMDKHAQKLGLDIRKAMEKACGYETLVAETDQLKKDLSSSDFELNMATSQLMDREKELAECKKDLLKLLPIARYNTNAFISYKEEENESGDEENDLKELGKDTVFIDELTAKYATDHIADVSKKVDGWLPIESAPKDGTRILLWDKAHGVRCGMWIVGNTSTGWNYSEPATHWQPLPKPPEKEGE